MSLIQRAYYSLDEAVSAWDLSEPELRYVVENSKLMLSARIRGAFDERDPKRGLIAGSDVFEGVVDVRRLDAIALLKGEALSLGAFDLSKGRTVELSGQGVPIALRRQDLLVRAEEWGRFEAQVIDPSREVLVEYWQFSSFDVGGEVFTFTDMQARALAFLYASAKIGCPEQHVSSILAAATSRSEKIAHLFSSRPGWRRFVLPIPGRRGWYLLDPGLVIAMSMPG